MPAPKGNKFWEIRTRHGRKKIFSNPTFLWKQCKQYFLWCEENPLFEHKVFHAQGQITHTKVPKLRAYTIGGLCIYLNITTRTWNGYKKDIDFFPILSHIESVIYNQKFTAASADLLNANIIARDLGLADKLMTENATKVTIQDPTEELKKRGIPLPDIDINDLEDCDE